MCFKKILEYISVVVLCCGVVVTPQVADTFTSIVASAEYEEYQHGGSCGENATYLIDENTRTLTISGTGDMGYTDPSNYSYGWDNYNDIYFTERIVIEDGITSISDNAFSGFTELKSITIPNSVTSIGDKAFWLCGALESIIIPDSVTSIGNSAFESCGALTSATIGNGVTSIGSKAFEYCPLTEITIPDSVTSIDEWAFSCCRALKNVTLGNGITNINYCAFLDCTSLENINIPDSVTSINGSAFDGCTSLTDVIIPDSVTSIDESAFNGCTSLTSVTIPNSVTSIGDKAFYGCTSLTSVTIPNSVTEIGYDAFGYQDYYYGYIGDDEWILNTIPEFIIYGVADSEAEDYAIHNRFNFVAIGEKFSPRTILTLKKYILGITEYGTGLDFNTDGNVNILDLTTALNKLNK